MNVAMTITGITDGYLTAFRNFSITCSLHGFAHLFKHRIYCVKQLWLLAILLAYACFVYELLLVGTEHFINKPTTSAITYTPRNWVKLPKVSICARLLSHAAISDDIKRRNGSVPLQSLIGYLTNNYIFSDIRMLFSEANMTTVFSKYPRLENLFRKMTENFEEIYGPEKGSLFIL